MSTNGQGNNQQAQNRIHRRAKCRMRNHNKNRDEGGLSKYFY